MVTKIQQAFTILIVCLILAPVIPTTPINGVLEREHHIADFTSKNVLIDESHCYNASSLWTPGNASFFGWILMKNGYNVSTNFDVSLDSGILDSYDILVLFFPMIELTTSEVTIITSFVNAGGGLLLVGPDGTNTWNFRPSNLNPVSEQFGISFVGDKVSTVTSEFAEHPVTTGMTQLQTYVKIIYGSSLDVSAPATAIISDGECDLVAVSESGLGRIVCVGAINPFLQYRRETPDNGVSDFQFSLNIIDWLAKNDQRTAIIPDIAQITVGSGPDLSEPEIESYDAFVGAYHDHTTHSDGQNTPDEMLEKAIDIGLDFFVVTDHSYDVVTTKGGITGGLAIKSRVEQNSLDLHIVVGAELSKGRHSAAFPLTENIITDSQQVMVDETHSQGGIIVLCHPTIGNSYAQTYDRFEELGYDAMEVDNSGYIYGMLEEGYFVNFMGASDGHSARYLGTLLNVAFVKNPTGPNGAISDQDLMDAVLNRRIVILDRDHRLVYGQEVWVNRWMELWDEANSTVESAETHLEGFEESTGIAQLYLDAAKTALNSWNFPRAIRLATNATSDIARGLNVEVIAPNPLDVEPDTDFDFQIQFSNNLSDAVTLNTSLFAMRAITVQQTYQEVTAQAGETEVSSRICHSDIEGFAPFWLNLVSFDTEESLNPLIIKVGVLINNITFVMTETGSRINVEARLVVGRTSESSIQSVSITYNGDSGAETLEMEASGFGYFFANLGEYAIGTNVTVTIQCIDTFDVVHTIDGEGIVKNPAAIGVIPPMDLILVIGGVAIVAVVGIVLVRRHFK